MPLCIPKRYESRQQVLNVVPFVDILFQLIIFFAIAYQLADMENLSSAIPDKCDSAQEAASNDKAVTLSITRTDSNDIAFAVGAEKINTISSGELAAQMTGLLNAQLGDRTAEEKVVTLRIDKDVPFSKAQHALAAVAGGSAKDVRLAVLKEDKKSF